MSIVLVPKPLFDDGSHFHGLTIGHHLFFSRVNRRLLARQANQVFGQLKTIRQWHQLGGRWLLR